MTTQVIMPQMGESIFEGTITKWLKKVGDKVSRDEPLFEISTDKVDSEIPSPAAGTLSEIRVAEGETVQINTVVAVIDGETRAAAPSAEAPAKTAVPTQPEKSPSAAPGREAAQKTAGPTGPQAPKASASPAAEQKPPREIRASPLVRRLAREHGVDLSDLDGTGLGGRITKQDILERIDQRTAPSATAPPPAFQEAAPVQPEPVSPPVAPVPATPGAEEGEVVRMTPMRKAIADHMVLSRRTSAHVSTIFEVDMTPIVGLRDRQRRAFEAREGIKLTYTPFFVKALVESVRAFPILNSSVSGDSIVFKRAVHVGIAVALETGLIVPVLKDAHLKSFTGLAHGIQDLAERARTKRLKPEDVQKGTITITNPGVYGSLYGTPIISQPQVAILGVGGIQKRPVVIDDMIAIRSMVYLSLSFDHRVIDGAVADQFMADLKERLQAWKEWVD